MSEQGGECIESNMKPYMDDYQSTVDGVLAATEGSSC